MSSSFPVSSSQEWNEGIAPPGPSFWESLSRIGTPVYGYLQEVAFAQTGINWNFVLNSAATRRLYVRKVIVGVDAMSSCLLGLVPFNNAYPSDPNRYGNQIFRRSVPSASVGGDNANMPTTVFMPFYLGPGQPLTLDFEGELFLDPGVSLAFSCHGVAPNPNTGSATAPSPNASVTAYGIEVDFDAY